MHALLDAYSLRSTAELGVELEAEEKPGKAGEPRVVVYFSDQEMFSPPVSVYVSRVALRVEAPASPVTGGAVLGPP